MTSGPSEIEELIHNIEHLKDSEARENAIALVQALMEFHGMNPMKVLQLVRSMGGTFKKILLVGCEPATFGPEEGQMGLSPAVATSVDRAVQVIMDLISEYLGRAQNWEANENGQEHRISERV